jgi:hypothetical protein
MNLLDQLQRQGVGILLDEGPPRAELRKLSESLDDEFDQVHAHLSALGMSHWEINGLLRPPKPTMVRTRRNRSAGTQAGPKTGPILTGRSSTIGVAPYRNSPSIRCLLPAESGLNPRRADRA